MELIKKLVVEFRNIWGGCETLGLRFDPVNTRNQRSFFQLLSVFGYGGGRVDIRKMVLLGSACHLDQGVLVNFCWTQSKGHRLAKGSWVGHLLFCF